jgi:adenylate cyclase
MHEVCFERQGGGDAAPRLRVAEGTTLIDAVRRAGLPIARACDGGGLCARCGVGVLSGAGALTPEEPAEAAAKDRNRIHASLRLACQVRVRGAVTVTAEYW